MQHEPKITPSQLAICFLAELSRNYGEGDFYDDRGMPATTEHAEEYALSTDRAECLGLHIVDARPVREYRDDNVEDNRIWDDGIEIFRETAYQCASTLPPDYSLEFPELKPEDFVYHYNQRIRCVLDGYPDAREWAKERSIPEKFEDMRK